MRRRRLSIAMCTYNGASYLQEQLDSIKSQTRMPAEIVVCDDHSNDDTIEIVKAFAQDVTFNVRLYINETNLGSTKNFEQAISLCEGDIIFLADQDDIWLPEKLSRMEEVFARFPNTAGVISDATIVDETLKPLGFRLWQATNFEPKQQRQAELGRLETLVKYNYKFMNGATFAFRSELRDKVLPIPDYWTHDAWIILIIASLAGIKIITDPMNLWRQHEQQQCGTWTKKSFSEMIEIAYKKDLSKEANLARKQLESARERINQMNIKDYDRAQAMSRLLKRLNEKSAHLGARSRISKMKIGRFYVIPSELVSLRYHRYSSGFSSAARDFFDYKD